jgi:nucleoside-diphosphate-sugar epimerase
MTRALIGHTGFVGGNLDRQGRYDAGFNSKNFRDMAGGAFDEVVCAGVQAVKWWANQNADEDWRRISDLLDVLATVKTRRFVLISTVDVYRDPNGVDEATPVDTEGLHPYGLHRWRVEEWVRGHHADHLILRLPGLFGEGLKKNLIFDALNGRDLSGFHPQSRFQFYDLSRLAADLDIAGGARSGTVNLATEPVGVADVLERLGVPIPTATPDQTRMAYDMRTRHGTLWGEAGGYIQSAGACLDAIAAYAAGASRAK